MPILHPPSRHATTMPDARRGRGELRRAGILVPLMALLALMVASCGAAPDLDGSTGSAADPDPGTAEQEEGEHLRIVTSFPVRSLDPIEGAHGNASFGAAETPLLLSPTGEPEPHLVEVERVDELTWELELTRDARFHNGRTVDAPALADALRDQLERRPTAQSQLPDTTVEAIDDRTVRLVTSRPDAAVPNHLADPGVFLVYDVDAVREAGDDDQGLLVAGHYTGPYVPVVFEEERLVLERNPDHWAGTPPLERVTVRIVADAQARLFAVESGEADVALYPPSDAEGLLAGVDGVGFAFSEIVAEGFRVVLDHREPPFDDVRVRRAVHLAVDEVSLAEDVLGGPYVPAVGLLPEELPGALALQRHDPQEAERLLEDAGWEPGDGGVRERDGQRLEFRLMTYPQQPDLDPMSVAIQAQLSEVGFLVAIERSEDINTTMEDPGAWEAALYCCGQVSGGGAIEPIWQRYFRTDGDVNWGAAGNAELDALIDELALADGERREELLAEIQRAVIEEEAAIFYAATRKRFAVTSERWDGFELRPNLIFVTAETAPSDS